MSHLSFNPSCKCVLWDLLLHASATWVIMWHYKSWESTRQYEPRLIYYQLNPKAILQQHSKLCPKENAFEIIVYRLGVIFPGSSVLMIIIAYRKSVRKQTLWDEACHTIHDTIPDARFRSQHGGHCVSTWYYRLNSRGEWIARTTEWWTYSIFAYSITSLDCYSICRWKALCEIQGSIDPAQSISWLFMTCQGKETCYHQPWHLLNIPGIF